MSVWPPVSIIIPTFNRAKIVKTTLELLHDHLVYRGKVTYYVGDQGRDDTPEVLAKSNFKDVQIIRAPRGGGLGINLNTLLKTSRDDYFLQMDDDHWLRADLDLHPHVAKLHDDPTAGWIKLFGVGSHKFFATLDGDYWRVLWDSPEVYIPSNRPHLKHRRFHDLYGYYPEGQKLGLTEEGFCHQCRDTIRQTGQHIDVLIPLDVATESGWDHVGESWQNRGY